MHIRHQIKQFRQARMSLSFTKDHRRGGLRHKEHLNLPEKAAKATPYTPLALTQNRTRFCPPPGLRYSFLAWHIDTPREEAQTRRPPIPNSHRYPSNIRVHVRPGTIASVSDTAVSHPGKHGRDGVPYYTGCSRCSPPQWLAGCAPHLIESVA